MQIDIAGKVIVLTGAASGIGRSLALGLAAEGARMAALARRRDQARRVVDEIGRHPGAPPALAPGADLGDEAAVVEAAAAVARARGRVDGLTNSAGWMPGSRPVLQPELSVLERVLGSSLIGSFLATKHFAPAMIRGGAPYGGSKAAVNVLAHVVHQGLAGEGVRTVAIAPGLTLGMHAVVGDAHIGRVAASYPGGRVGQPEDIVGLVAFLCSDAANHISGPVITVRPPVVPGSSAPRS